MGREIPSPNKSISIADSLVELRASRYECRANHKTKNEEPDIQKINHE